MSSSKLPYLLWGCAIAGLIPVEWIIWQIMLRILSICLAWICGNEEQISVSGWQNTCLHAVLPAESKFLVLHLHCAQPLRPNCGGDPNLGRIPGWQNTMEGHYVEVNEHWVDFINQWSIFHFDLLFALEVCPVNKIHNFSRCKTKHALNCYSGH